MTVAAVTLLALLAAGPPSFRFSGKLLQREAVCLPDGKVSYVERPVAGQRLVARVGQRNSAAPPVAESVTDQEGGFSLLLGADTYCIVDAERQTPGCRLVVRGAVEGMHQENIVKLETLRPIQCEGPKKYKVRGEVLQAIEPCGDQGEPPSPIPGARLMVKPGATNTYQREPILVSSDPQGRFEVDLLPGEYCLTSEQKGRSMVPQLPQGAAATYDETCMLRRGRQCDATFQVADTGVEGVNVVLVKACGDICVRADPSLPLTARGVGRVAAAGGVRHVRGVVKATASWFSGVPPREDYYQQQRNPPPTPGERVLVRPGPQKAGQPPVAEVVTDERGRFDVALPPGTFCILSGFRDTYFRPPPVELPDSNVNYTCMRAEYVRCDAVVTLAEQDHPAEIEIRVHRPSPVDAPCMKGPYSGPMPPSAAPRVRPP